LPIVSGEIEIKDFEPNFGSREVAPERFEWWKNRIMRTWELIA
jgi:O-succinylbenzoate synthase